MGKDIFSKKSRFSIRKLNIGVCSVLLGTLIMIGHTAQADETTSDGATVAATAVSASQGEGVPAETSPITAPESVSTTTVAPAVAETVAATAVEPTSSVAPASTSASSSAPANSVATSTSPVIASEVTSSTNVSTAKPATASEASRSVTASTTSSTTASSEITNTNNITVSETANTPRVRSRRAAGQERSMEGRDIKYVYQNRTATVNGGTPTQRTKIEYRQLGDYEVVDGKTVATDPSGQGRPVLEWTVTFNEAEYDKMGGYYYFSIPKNVSDPYNVVTEYNNGAYSDRYGWKDANKESAGSLSKEGTQYIDDGKRLEWRVKETVGKDYNNVDGLSGVMADTKKVYVLRFDNNTRARKVTIKYRTVVEDTSQVISYIAGVDSKTGLPRNNWYAISGKYDKNLVSQVDAPSVTPNLTNTSINVPIQTVDSTSSTLSGTGIPGATIKLYIDGQEQNIGNVTVDSNGNWTTGELPTALNNNQGEGTTIKPRQTVEVSQVVNGEESSRRTVPVSVGVTTVEPSSLTTNQDAVVAGQKEVTLKVPHDAGIAYMRYTNSAGETAEIPVKRDNLSAAWTSQKPEAATVKSVENGKFQDTIVLTMADKIAGTEVAAISNVVEGGFSSVAGWQPRGVENQAPTIESAVEGNQKTVAQGAQLDLASLVTVADKEDDAQATLGDKVHAEVISVNGNAGTKTVDTNTPGTYTVKYKAVDSQGKESDEIEVTVVVENKTPETPKPQPETPKPQPETPKPAGQAPEIVNDLAGKASTPADVTVKAPAGSTVKLYNNDGVVIGEAVANDQGVATITPTNSLPEGEITATSTPAGGTESAKSALITVTKTPTPYTPPGQTNGPYKLQMATNTTQVTVHRGDHLSLTGAAAGTALRYFGITRDTAFNVQGVNPSGGLLTNGTKRVTQSNAQAEGNVSWSQPLGDTTIVFRAEGSPDPTSSQRQAIERKITVTVIETTKKYDPVAGTKVDIANPNNVSEDEKNKIIDSVKTANPNHPAESQYSVDEKGNLTITYPDGSTDKIAAAYLVNPTTPAAPVVAPTVEIPYSNKATKEVYVYAGEENSFDIKFKDDSGKIASATVKQGGNRPFASVAGEADTINTQYGFKANVINAETPATADAPAVITYSGTPAATDGLKPEVLEAATKGENPEGMALGWRYATATDTDGAYIDNKAVGSSNATDPGSFRVMLKAQTQKYDIVAPTEKVAVADPANVTDADLAKIKEKLQLEYSQTNDDANLADKKGTTVADADKDAKIQSVTKDDKGNLVVTYKDGSQDKKPLLEFVTKTPTDADKNEPTPKAQTVDKGTTPKAEDSIGNVKDLPEGTTVTFKDPVDTTTPGEKDATVVVTYPDGSTDEVPVKVTVKEPSSEPKDADKNEPTPKAQTVDKGTTPKAEDSIGNVKDLPEGTTVAFKDPVDTTTPGEKDATVVVTYPDGSTDEVPVKVTVKEPSSEPKDADKNEPTPKAQTVDKGTTPKAEDSIDNLKDLPKGTTVAFKDPVDTTTPGDKAPTVVVTYPDGSTEEVPVKVTVKDPSAPATDADKNTPVAKDQTVKPGDKPKAEDSIGNVGDLPEGTTVEFKTPVDTTTPGEKDATVVVTYPDGSKDEVPVKVTVKEPTDAEKNAPVAKDQTVKPGDKPKAEDSIGNVGDLPEGTTVAFKDPVDTTTPGEKDATVVVTYPDGSTEEVPVKVTVKDPSAPATDADKNTPVAKDQTVKPGDKPNAKDSIGNVGDLPEGTTVEFKTPVDTTTPGEKDATVVVTYPDGSKDEVPVKVTVKDPSAPAKPVVATDLTDKAGTKTPVEVSAEPGSKVELFDKDGNKIGEATADENGKATITPTVDIPAGKVTAKATDVAGNTSDASDPMVATTDTTAPAKPVVNTVKAGDTAITGTAKAGSTVEVTLPDGSKVSAKADQDGNFSVPVSGLKEGDTVSVTATDDAGNTSNPTSVTVGKGTDTIAPDAPVVNTDLTGKAGTRTPIDVIAEPGSKVELFDKDGNKIGEATANEKGLAVVVPTVNIPEGNVTARATDLAGNVSGASAPMFATTSGTVDSFNNGKGSENTPTVVKPSLSGKVDSSTTLSNHMNLKARANISSTEKDASTLPETGDEVSIGGVVLGGILAAAGLAIAGKRRKED
ncbi:Rib/alpha-like domain-containing protein [Streptococcus salivarius]|uniref:Rib/alpha-like domain-containing protein n=1 Tax=Streptococcus salivarius TaxID=1304 RepID=UPI002676CF26|nr:Rib/alpha-like domain-containing protein [Streptococcus salivarius]